jgi:hypothetical protein
MGAPLPQTDNVFRGAHHPIVFKKSIFRPGPFLRLYNEQNPRLIEASFVCQRYAPELCYVHSYGCRNSRERNRRRRSGEGDVYCGAYQLKVATVRGLPNTVGLTHVVVTMDIVHQIENDQIAHAALKIELNQNVPEAAIEGIKTAIVDRLWRWSHGPVLHRCKTDRKLVPHPNTLLPTGPAGAYIEDRTIRTRIWYLVRFWFLLAAWKLGLASL